MNNLLPIPLVRRAAGSSQDLGPHSSMIDLVRFDDLPEVQRRFQQPPLAGNINVSIHSCGNTLLHTAAGYGSLRIMKWALEQGANINQLTKRGWSPAAEAEYWAGR